MDFFDVCTCWLFSLPKKAAMTIDKHVVETTAMTSTWLNLTKDTNRQIHVFLGIICTAVSYEIYTSKARIT